MGQVALPVALQPNKYLQMTVQLHRIGEDAMVLVHPLRFHRGLGLQDAVAGKGCQWHLKHVFGSSVV
jgi:hypothetical protein